MSVDTEDTLEREDMGDGNVVVELIGDGLTTSGTESVIAIHIIAIWHDLIGLYGRKC